MELRLAPLRTARQIVRTSFLPRLVLTGLAIVCLMLALGPILHQLLLRKLGQITGSQWQAGRLESDLSCGRIVMHDVRVGDPETRQVLFEADRVQLELDRQQCWQARLVVPRGSIDGLRFHSKSYLPDPTPSGLSSDPKSPQTDLAALKQRLTGWLRAVHQLLTEADGTRADLPSVALAERLLQDWPQRGAELLAEISQLRSQIAQLQTALAAAGENPLRNTESYPQALRSLEQIARELARIREKLQQDQEQQRRDWEQLQAFRQLEEQAPCDPLPAPELDPRLLAQYLLCRDVEHQVQALIHWVRWSRQYVRDLRGITKHPLQSNRRIFFAGSRPVPEVWIDSLAIRGGNTDSRYPFQIEGTILRLSSQPEWNSHPSEMILQTTGSFQAVIQVTFSSHPEPLTRVMVNSPEWQRDEYQLGDATPFAVIVAAGTHQLGSEWTLRGNALHGSMHWVRPKPSLSPRLASELADTEVAPLLGRAVRELDSLHVRVALRGTLDHPKWELETDLGADFSQRFQTALQERILAQQRHVSQLVHQRLIPKLHAVDRQLSSTRDEAMGELDAGQRELRILVHQVAQRLDWNETALSTDSPLRDILRR